MGADGVELDVRRTADGRLAVVHDAHLPDGRAVVETAWSAMPPGTADLDAVLDACAGLALVNVEIKNWPDDVDFDPSFAHVDAVVAALAGRPAEERSRFVVSCFHLPSVDRVRELAPDLVTAWLVIGPPGDAEAGQMVAEVVAHGHQALHPHHACRDAGAGRARPRGRRWRSTRGPATTPTASAGWPTRASTPS